MHAFHGLPQAAAEADGKDEVALIHGADEVGDAPCGCGREDGQAEQRDLILKIIGKDSSEIAGEDYDAPGVVEALGERDQAWRIQAVLEAVQILEILFESIANIGRHAGDATAGLHGVERSGESDGEIVQMALEITVACETEPANDTHDGSGVGVKALGHGTDTEEHVLARMFE